MSIVVEAKPEAQRELLEQRIYAATLSQGFSDQAIHQAVVGMIKARGLGGTVLDFGAGVGYLTRRLLAMGCFGSVTAFDLMRRPEDMENVQWVAQDLNQPVEGYDAAFDVVVAAEVIEHLENPRQVMRELSRMLRPGGTAIVTTPNNESWRSVVAYLVRGHFAGFGAASYPAHITALLRKDFERICGEVRLAVPQFSYSNYGRIPGCPKVSWQRISFGLLGGLRFSDALVVVVKKT